MYKAIAPPPLTHHVSRICSEYLEMPGLRLTPAQAQRLLALDATLCTQALQFLVDAQFLRRTERGEYVRLTEGMIGASALTMAKAHVEHSRRQRQAS